MTNIDKIISSAYQYFAKNLVDNSTGRALADPDFEDIDGDKNRKEMLTYSEGVSYALLLAVAMNDKKTFDKVLTWALQNLQRKNIKGMASGKKDHLFAWRWTPTHKKGKVGGLAEKNDRDPSSDADQDIALALFRAYKKWGDAQYLSEGRAIVKDIWNKLTFVVGSKRVLMAGDTQYMTRDPINGKKTIGVDVSYFRPSSWENEFSEYDSPRWKDLVSPAYEIMEKAADATMHDDKGRPVQGKVNLAPDWAAVSAGTSGELIIHDHGWKRGDHKKADYFAGGDAFRVPFWMAVQAELNPSDPFAQRYLSEQTGTTTDFGPLAFFAKQVKANEPIYSGYRIDGKVEFYKRKIQNSLTYATYLYAAGKKDLAQKIFDKAMTRFNPNGFFDVNPADFYYGNAWALLNLIFLRKGAQGLLGEDKERAFPLELPQARKLKYELPVGIPREWATEFLDSLRDKVKGLYGGEWGITGVNAKIAKIDQRLKKLRDKLDRVNLLPHQIISNKKLMKSLKLQKAKEKAKLGKGTVNQHIIIWLLQSEGGTQGFKILDKSLDKYGQLSAFWQAKAPMVLAAKSEDPKIWEYLKGKAKKFGLTESLFTDRKDKGNRLKIFKGLTPLVEAQSDPMLKAENYLNQGLLAYTLGQKAEARELFGKVLAQIQPLLDTENSSSGADKTYKKELLKKLVKRIKDKKSAGKEYNMYLSLAKIWKAKIITTLASDKTVEMEYQDQQKAIALLKQATMKKNAEGENVLGGLQLLEAKRAIAEALMLSAFILKDKDGDYQPLLNQAKGLVLDIKRWNDEYADELKRTPKKQAPRWLHQIHELALILETKISMVEIGEERDGYPREYIQTHLTEFEEIAKTLYQVLDSEVLDGLAKADIKTALAQNLSRQAGILFDQGKRSQALELLTEAKTLLNQALSDGSKNTKIEANLWLANIYLLEAGKILNKTEKYKILVKAEKHITEALTTRPNGRHFLKGILLSFAYQCHGGIHAAYKRLPQAKAMYQAAINTSPKNYYAWASLGDVNNWMGHYSEAIDAYKKVPKMPDGQPQKPAYLKAQAGILEATLRDIKNYKSITNPKYVALFKQIFQGEAAASPLIGKGIELIIEAYISEKTNQASVINLTNSLLGTKFETKAAKDALTELMPHINPNVFEPKFKVVLNLRLVQVLTWGKRFEEAEKISDKIAKDFKEVLAVDKSLKAWHELAKATVKMRKEKSQHKAQPAVYAAVKSFFKEVDDDPDLSAEAVFILVEEFMVERDFLKIAELIKDVLANKPINHFNNKTLAEIEKVFIVRGQKKKFKEFKIKLMMAQADALSWKKKYAEAGKIYLHILNKENPSPLATMQIYISLGNINAYQRKFESAEGLFDFVMREIKTIETKDQTYDHRQQLAEAQVRKADIERYGKNPKNPKTAIIYYKKALEIYKSLSTEGSIEALINEVDEVRATIVLLYLGLGKAYQMDGDQILAAHYIGKAKSLVTGDLEEETISEIERSNAFAARRYLQFSSRTIIDNKFGGIEQQYKLDFKYQVLKGLMTVGGRLELAQANGLTYFSAHPGLDIYPTKGLNIGAEFLLPMNDTWKPLEIREDKKARIKYVKPYKAELHLRYDHPYFAGAGSVAFDSDMSMNRYFLDLRVKLAGTGIPVLSGLNLGIVFSKYGFTYQGTLREQMDIGPALGLNVDLFGDVGALFGNYNAPYDWAKLNLEGQLLWQGTPGKGFSQNPGFRFSGGFDFHTGALPFIFKLAYTYQGSELHSFHEVGLGIKLDLP